ncbi:hypothetical protein FQA47_008017 [Oryzias melastigma]|uniref:Uncharacterized protein n=1 Tax=Oryzias melastigma TaxID=30732 RepID=A0A834FFJ5_ORYME|nr:hypothetical protein FQA47_008017 [Oryzias melastigma]
MPYSGRARGGGAATNTAEAVRTGFVTRSWDICRKEASHSGDVSVRGGAQQQQNEATGRLRATVGQGLNCLLSGYILGEA